MSVFLILMARYRRQQQPQVRIHIEGAGVTIQWGAYEEVRFAG